MKAVVAALLLLSVPALADTPAKRKQVAQLPDDGPPPVQAPGMVPVAPPVAPVAPAPAKAEGLDARQKIAGSNHGLIASTAVTVPEGKVEVTLQAIVPFAGIASLNAGITKTTELWVDGAATAEDEDDERAYGVGIKQVLFKNRSIAVALTGSLRKMSDFGDDGWKSLGVVGSLCVDPSCGLMVSGGLQKLWPLENSYDYDYESSPATMLTLSASLGGTYTRALIDIISIDRESVVFLGARFGNKSMSFDAGLVLAEEGDGETIPWLGLSSRL